MSNNGHYTMCPYYRDEKNKSISCEDTFRRFTSRKKKYKWMSNFCDDSWSDCPYAQALNDLWERIDMGADKDIELLEHQLREVKREQKKLSSQLGKAEKQNAKDRKTIKDLKERIENLIQMYRKANQKYLDEKTRNTKVANQVFSVANMYEGFMAYMLSVYGCSEFRVESYEKWSKDKEFKLEAIERDKNGKPLVFKAVVRKVEDEGNVL